MAGFKAFFDWYHENGILPNVWKGATGLKLILQKIHCHYIILSAYALRIWPALKRRFGTVVKRGKA